MIFHPNLEIKLQATTTQNSQTDANILFALCGGICRTKRVLLFASPVALCLFFGVKRETITDNVSQASQLFNNANQEKIVQDSISATERQSSEHCYEETQQTNTHR